MSVHGDTLSHSDFARLAHLHVRSIDDSLPALLGERYAARFYRFLAASEQERLFVERVHGRLESCCVVSLDPASLQGRIARSTLLPLAASALRALARSGFRAYLRGVLGDLRQEDHGPPPAPEITYIFTHPDLRGVGLGGLLVERVDAHLRAEGHASYFVKTIDDPGNRAIGFYQENGFVPIGPRIEAGRRYVEFERKLETRHARIG